MSLYKLNNTKVPGSCDGFPIKKIIYCLVMLLFSLQPFAQTHEATGIVKNETGHPIPLVSVTIKGTGQATFTDVNGAFILPGIDSNAVLLFSSIGYETTEYKTGSSNRPFSIVLKQGLKDLQNVEVISTGYQDIPKERATGSFVKVDNTTLNQQAGTNILKRLDGVTSGLIFNTGRHNSNPDNKTAISIRGLSTINGPLDPLIVLDGFIYEGDINNINPNDIDNITILKDATATSIWGSRAGNGVIVITTKKGRLNQKLQVSLTAGININAKPDLHDLPLMSSADYIDAEQFLFGQGYFDGTINNPYLALTPAVQIFLQRRNGFISAADSAARINALKGTDARDQYKKYVYTKAVTQQYAINIQGGNNNNAYTFSMAYDHSRSELNAPGKKINIRVDNLFQPVKNLGLNISVYYTNTDAGSGRQPYNTLVAGRQVPYLKLADDMGNALPVPSQYNDLYTDTAGGGRLLNWKYYPLEDYKHSFSKSNLQELFANAGVQYKLFHFLDIDLKYQYQNQVTDDEQINDIDSYAARDMINRFSQLDASTGVITYVVPYGGIQTTTHAKTVSHTARGQLNYNQARKNHFISAIIGTEARQVTATGSGNIIYGYNADPLTGTVADYVNSYPTFITGDYDQVPGGSTVSNTIHRFVSLYANAAYTYYGRYTLSASARRDGSNIFGLTTNDKWKPLWSSGAGWKISSEPFYHASMLPFLKLRLTYGYSGNVDLSKSAAAIGNYYPSSSINFPFVRINVINNPDLRWEKIGIFNAGIDFEFKNKVLTGSFDYYRKHGSDLYGTTAYDYTTWGASDVITSNIADMKGKGFDLALNARMLDRKVTWNSILLLNYNTNKTTKYNNKEAKDIGSIIAEGTRITPFIGKPLYAIAAYKWGGLDTAGNPQGFVNGQLTTDYQAIFNEALEKGLDGNVIFKGSSVPVVFGSFINTFSWKGISLSANIAYKFGYYFRKSSFTSSGLVQGSAAYSDYEKRWQKPGDEAFTDIPAFLYPDNGDRDGFFASSEINVLRGDHIRLQYINLSYAPKMLFPKLPLRDVQLYVYIANLGILWRANKEKFDPDYPGALRPSKSFAFGLRAAF